MTKRDVLFTSVNRQSVKNANRIGSRGNFFSIGSFGAVLWRTDQLDFQNCLLTPQRLRFSRLAYWLKPESSHSPFGSGSVAISTLFLRRFSAFALAAIGPFIRVPLCCRWPRTGLKSPLALRTASAKRFRLGLPARGSAEAQRNGGMSAGSPRIGNVLGVNP